MSNPPPLPPDRRGVSTNTLLLTVWLAAIAAPVVVMVVGLYFTSAARSGNAGAPGQPPALTGSAPNVQKDTVKPLGKPAGEVFYEVPYASPPHLTLSAPHRIYRIVKQDEYGFSWEADSIAEDFLGDVKVVAAALIDGSAESQLAKKHNIEYEDFTYEAKGIRAGADADLGRPLEQPGSFQSVLGANGQENFAIPYASPPQVTLEGHNGTTVIVEATNTGFKWKNNGKDNPFPGNNEGPVTWIAKGTRATKLPK